MCKCSVKDQGHRLMSMNRRKNEKKPYHPPPVVKRTENFKKTRGLSSRFAGLSFERRHRCPTRTQGGIRAGDERKTQVCSRILTALRIAASAPEPQPTPYMPICSSTLTFNNGGRILKSIPRPRSWRRAYVDVVRCPHFFPRHHE